MNRIRDISECLLINRAFMFLLAISLLALTFSFGIEVINQIQPCKLCNIQRACYFSILLSALLGIFSSKKNIIAFMLILLSLTSVCIAFYHIGIQFGIFTDSCAVDSPTDLNNFKNMLFHTKKLSCASVHWFLGLPISVWSLFFSLICFIVITLTLKLKSEASNDTLI